MIFRLLADVTALVHLGFVGFVVAGALLAVRNRWWMALHVPAVVWAVVLEWTGAICPLTPLENSLRLRAGQAGYAGGFIEHYLLPLLYPAGLTRSGQLILGVVALAINLIAYSLVWVLWHRSRQAAIGRR